MFRLYRAAPVCAALAAITALAAAACGSAPATAAGPAAHTARAAAPPVITTAAAGQVLASYVAGINRANGARSDRLLSVVESGSSYRMDAGDFRWTRVSDPANTGYAPLALATAAFCIPRAAGPGPASWAVLATWKPAHGKHPPQSYLLFTQEAGTWREVLEPNLVAAPAPAAAAAVTATSAPAVPPGQLPGLTARYLDGQAGAQITVPARYSLTDEHDYLFWFRQLPPGSQDHDTHAVTADPVYSLNVAGGGALVFYDLSAQLTLGAPGGQPFQITIPGYYAGTPVTVARLTYVEQFAAYDPPRGTPRVVAEIAGPEKRG